MKNFFYSLTLYEKAKFFILIISTIYCFDLSLFLITNGVGIHWSVIFVIAMGFMFLGWAVSPKVPIIDIFNKEDVEESKLSEKLESLALIFLLVSGFLYLMRSILQYYIIS